MNHDNANVLLCSRKMLPGLQLSLEFVFARGAHLWLPAFHRLVLADGVDPLLAHGLRESKRTADMITDEGPNDPSKSSAFNIHEPPVSLFRSCPVGCHSHVSSLNFLLVEHLLQPRYHGLYRGSVRTGDLAMPADGIGIHPHNCGLSSGPPLLAMLALALALAFASVIREATVTTLPSHRHV